MSCLNEQGEGGHWSPEAGISANTVDAGEGLAAIWGPWVFAMARRVCAWGTLKKEPRWIMRVETPDVNSWTWRRMYLRKASLDHRPTSMIVCVGTSFRHIAIAAPLRMECDPNSEGWQPRTSSPITVADARILSTIRVAGMYFNTPLTTKAFTGASLLVLGHPRTRFTRAAQARTGQRVASWVQCCAIVTSRSSCFWNSKVTETESAERRDRSL